MSSQALIEARSRFWRRGLVNCHNNCFLNSVIQALLSCGHFCRLMEQLDHGGCISASTEPFTHEILHLLHDFRVCLSFVSSCIFFSFSSSFRLRLRFLIQLRLHLSWRLHAPLHKPLPLPLPPSHLHPHPHRRRPLLPSAAASSLLIHLLFLASPMKTKP